MLVMMKRVLLIPILLLGSCAQMNSHNGYHEYLRKENIFLNGTLDKQQFSEKAEFCLNAQSLDEKARCDPFFNALIRTRNYLGQGEEGVDDISNFLREALKNPHSPENMVMIRYGVDALWKMAEDGVSNKEMLCVLLETLENQISFVTTMRTAFAIQRITGVDVAWAELGQIDEVRVFKKSRGQKLLRWKTVAQCCANSSHKCNF